jgi:phospholipid-binding lipoprotein MlaA
MITTHFIARYAVFTCAALLFLLLSGCASGPKANPTDPLESFNRNMFAFNEGIDKAVLKPVAQGYRAVAPYPVRAGVSHFYDNLEDAWTTLNAVLQLRPKVAADSLMRFSVNSIFGLAGVLDIATELGIERHSEDFGKTLGRWGTPSGPYLVFPLFGPSTLRDSTTIVLENRFDPVSHIDDIRLRNSLTGLRLVDTRSNLLPLGNLLDEAALDKYSFTRDAFLQKRRAEIYRPGASEDDGYRSSDEESSPSKRTQGKP